MNLNEKAQYYQRHKKILLSEPLFIDSFEKEFLVRYTYESTVMEGNTLSYQETESLLLKNKTPGGKDMREIYEQINHKNAFEYITQQIRENQPINEDKICKIHKIVTDQILDGGKYRAVQVRIGGAKHECPYPEELPERLKRFYNELEQKRQICNMPESNISPIDLAAWVHAEFVAIHPFIDGNGRTSRLMMNYELIENGYVPISIPLEKKSEYCDCLDHYACTEKLEPFTNFICKLEEKELNYLIENEKRLLVCCELEK